jgi:hypothetical protein
MKPMNYIVGCTLLAVSLTTIGCGSGFKASGMGVSNGAQSVSIDSEIARAQAATQSAQQAIDDANAVVRTLMDDQGNINLGLFLTGDAGSANAKATGLLSPIIDQLNSVFNQVFAKATAVKQQFEDARNALNAALVQLSANDPTQAAQIAQIQAQLGQIDAMEAAFRTSMQMLATKLGQASTALQSLISGATSFIPGWGAIVNLAINFFVMDDVNNLIATIQAKLLSL